MFHDLCFWAKKKRFNTGTPHPVLQACDTSIWAGPARLIRLWRYEIQAIGR